MAKKPGSNLGRKLKEKRTDSFTSNDLSSFIYLQSYHASKNISSSAINKISYGFGHVCPPLSFINLKAGQMHSLQRIFSQCGRATAARTYMDTAPDVIEVRHALTVCAPPVES